MKKELPLPCVIFTPAPLLRAVLEMKEESLMTRLVTPVTDRPDTRLDRKKHLVMVADVMLDREIPPQIGRAHV